LQGGATTRVTNVLSGVSGITPMTPALSVAAAAQGLVFTVFEDNDYNIYSAQSAAQLAGRAAEPAARDAAILPPVPQPSGQLAQLLGAPATGLPKPTEYPVEPYHPKLTLDQVGQPTLGIGADRFGAYGGGGISFALSDVLGNHEIAALLQVTNRASETGAIVQYINRTRRWNWGLVAERTPYVTGSFGQGLTDFNGETAFIEQTYRVTQTNNAVTGLVQYPFSRARRVEFSSGVRHIGFDRRIETQVFSGFTGALLERTTEKLPSEQAINLSETSAALVYDTSLFGATAPILGQRYRFEYTQEAGSIVYAGLLADYRRYVMPLRPFTIAVRGVHYGRYGRDSEDVRISPLYLGYPGLVRGYDVNSFGANECAADSRGACPAFDQTVGSRMIIGNAELRFPLYGQFSRRSFYGPLPIELALFTDAGVAWNSDSKPTLFGGDRDWVRSAGAALRFNAFGYAVGEIDYVRPLDRASRGWMWQFNLVPGF
jgi:hypothetical protein